MLDVEGIKQACENIDATFLEPAAGDGNFFVLLLKPLLAIVHILNYSKKLEVFRIKIYFCSSVVQQGF